jgi:hypothetical protein
MASPSPHGRRPRARLDTATDCFHRVVCPLCNGPMTARVGRHGPYFHCLCPDRQAARPARTGGNNGDGRPGT